VDLFDGEVIPAPPGDRVAAKAAAVFTDVDREAEGEEGRLVLVAGAVEAEPAAEVAPGGTVTDVVGDAGGPPP
jgi:hypothetical protein